MKNLSRPPVDMELIQEHFESYGAALTRRLEIAATHASALSTVVSTARTLAGSVAVVQPQSDELCRALRIGVRAAAALFAVATGNGMVEVDLGEMRTKLPATGPTDAGSFVRISPKSTSTIPLPVATAKRAAAARTPIRSARHSSSDWGCTTATLPASVRAVLTTVDRADA